MSGTYTRLEEKIRAQQGVEGTDVWMIGEQLLEIAEREPASAELLEKDLEVAAMSLPEAAKTMKAFADEKHRKIKGNFVCVTPKEADGVLRKFYGLPEKTDTPVIEKGMSAEPVEDDFGLLGLLLGE